MRSKKTSDVATHIAAARKTIRNASVSGAVSSGAPAMRASTTPPAALMMIAPKIATMIAPPSCRAKFIVAVVVPSSWKATAFCTLTVDTGSTVSARAPFRPVASRLSRNSAAPAPCTLIGGGKANPVYAAFWNTALVRYVGNESFQSWRPAIL
jgi:hypothetical protein